MRKCGTGAPQTPGKAGGLPRAARKSTVYQVLVHVQESPAQCKEFRQRAPGWTTISDSPRVGGRGLAAYKMRDFWARSRKGRWVVKRKTAKGRFGRSLKRVARWCRFNRHRQVRDQHVASCRKRHEHYAYFGITGNARALARYCWQVERVWRKWLDRRSWHADMTWERFGRLLEHYPLPTPRIVHSVYRVAANP